MDLEGQPGLDYLLDLDKDCLAMFDIPEEPFSEEMLESP
jgi:hypothetical protein